MSNIPLGMVTAAIPEPVATPAVAAGASAATAETAAVAAAASQPSAQALLVMAHQVGAALKARNSGLNYAVDMIGGAPRIRVIDGQTGQVVRQFPSDQILTTYQAMERGEPVLVSRKG